MGVLGGYRDDRLQAKLTLTSRNSVVSKSWKLRFGLCHEKVIGYTVLMEIPRIENTAEISRIGGGVKIAKIERKVQAPR
jgi:hypothetical protein